MESTNAKIATKIVYAFSVCVHTNEIFDVPTPTKIFLLAIRSYYFETDFLIPFPSLAENYFQTTAVNSRRQ